MRQVRVSRKAYTKAISVCGQPNYVPPQLMLQEFDAIFHDFYEDSDHEPCAIVEKSDGSLDLVHVLQMTFLNPQSFETCENKS